MCDDAFKVKHMYTSYDFTVKQAIFFLFSQKALHINAAENNCIYHNKTVYNSTNNTANGIIIKDIFLSFWNRILWK